MHRSVHLTALAVSLLIPMISIAHEVTFSDVPADAWFATYVHDASDASIVSGYKDVQGNLTGKFGPGDPVTIAQALKIAVEGAGYDVADYESNEQCGMGMHWAAGYVCVAVVEKFTLFRVGIDPGINLDQPATRAEVAQLFASAFKVDTETPVGNRYDDVTASTQFAFSIEALSRDGILSGDTDAEGHATGKFRPTDEINRAETVKMVIGARAEYGEPGEGSSSSDESQATTNVVTYTDDGYSPSELHVQKGAKVTFKNDSQRPMWTASDPHPEHTGLQYFDAGRGVPPGETYEFDFLKEGTWGFHNHAYPFHRGMISVTTSFEDKSCDELQQLIDSEMNRVNSCMDDSDCISGITGLHGFARYDCDKFHSRNAVLTDIQKLDEAYASHSCPPWANACPNPVGSSVRCVQAKCVRRW